MAKAELESIVPEKSFVIYAEQKFKVASLNGTHIGIYDEPPSEHVDLINHQNCKLII